MDTASARVLPKGHADSLCKILIPRCGERNSAGCGGLSIIPDANWAVRHFEAGKTDVWNFADIKRVKAAYEIDLFFQRKLLEQRIDSTFDVGLRRRRLAHRRHNAQQDHRSNLWESANHR